MSSERVLVLGSGGREHAFTSKLAQSNLLEHIYVSPGNAGTHASCNSKISNADIPINNHAEVVTWCKNNSIDLVVVGPEEPLANGIQDDLSAAGLLCFGPSKAAAQIEASKEFAKEFMNRHGIPTARWKSFTDEDLACQHIDSAPYEALVVKVNGLAAGKGVAIARCADEAKFFVRSFFKEKSGKPMKVIVEELLEGQEVSVLCFSDGKNIKVMPPSQDYKRLSDNDGGPNTGGMGAYCPCLWVSSNDLKMIEKNVLQRTVRCLEEEGIPFKGVLYAGLMITRNGPQVLEFNCRFGDPETQVILPLLRSDLYSIMKSCAQGKLDTSQVVFDSNSSAVAVVLVSSGYPRSYHKFKTITGIEKVNSLENVQVIHAGTYRDETNDSIVTNGGRVLAIVAKTSDLETAIDISQKAASEINFEGKFYRSDIGIRGILRKNQNGFTYASSGVNISAGHELVSQIKNLTEKTSVSGVLGSIGGFGGLFSLKAAGYGDDTILVSGTDGVGTKLLIAQQCDMHATIGIDLVAMCVNDVLCHGAQPLFFLDYFACGKLNVQATKAVIEGIANGCRQASCALIGGETAEMPGMYSENKYDLAGFCVGAVSKQHLLPRLNNVVSGDVVVGIASSGLHSNGFSLVRKIIEKSSCSYGDVIDGQPLGELLLRPTQIYTGLLPLIKRAKAFAHITGGGLLENLPRVLPPGISATLDASKWTMPSVFGWLASQGNVDCNEMLRTFNCGIGAALIVDGKEDVEKWLEEINGLGQKAWNIGKLHDGAKGDESRIKVTNFDQALKKCTPLDKSPASKEIRKVGVLISGSGTNLQALIDASHNFDSPYQISLVISNVQGVEGLKRSERAGIKTKVINHKDYESRELFDAAIHEVLVEGQIEFVCLAGFMRILSGWFVNKWKGRLLNTHPSLLPSFRGMHAARQAINAGVVITGCTVHFVSEELDAGAIITQEPVVVIPEDTETTLQERIKKSEHLAYPRALKLLTSQSVVLGNDGKIRWAK